MACDDDVPSGIDLRDPGDVATWIREADVKRPWRAEVRGMIADLLRDARRVLELGSGPGLLAERVLQTCAIDEYVLFDFSPPMLEASRARVGEHPAARHVLGDFKQPDWTAAFTTPFDAAVGMQSIHEIRHKRHLPGLYREIHGLLRPGGIFVVCDHEPTSPTKVTRAADLMATEAEQHAALAAAGYTSIATHARMHHMYICSGTR